MNEKMMNETNLENVDVLEQYASQTQSEDVHFTHADWIYSDYSDSCCC